jgi:hypothetical protein
MCANMYVCVYIRVYVVAYRYNTSLITPISSFCKDKKSDLPQHHNKIAEEKSGSSCFVHFYFDQRELNYWAK